MMKRFVFILTFCILHLSNVVRAQDIHSSNHLSLDLGIGYSKLGLDIGSLNDNIDNPRDQFILLTSFKLKYAIPVTDLSKHLLLEITPFAGYNMFGGKSKELSNGYKDVIHLQSIETGFLPTVSIGQYLKLFGGFKGQYIFSARQKAYGTLMGSGDAPRDWATINIDDDIKDLGFNAGAGLNYRIKKITIGIETWFGITDISESEELKIKDNHFRFTVGYTLK